MILINLFVKIDLIGLDSNIIKLNWLKINWL